ncbi:MAG: arylesterase [Alphaproteobacteria bacterium]
MLALSLLALLPGQASGASAPAKITLVALGDSLTAGYGLAGEAAFPVRLERALRQKGYKVSVVNAGVSGDTTRAGLARLSWSVGADADGVIVQLGANDALRGINPTLVGKNLDAMLTALSRRNMPVLLAGMLAPRNMGAEYSAQFDAIYPALAKRHDVEFYPFFLEGVATIPELFQADGLHPTARGVDVIVEGILPDVEALIERIKSRL